MKLLRSWPEKVPDDRCYVVDTLPRIVMKDYDYRCLGDVDDDILLLEWDVACTRESLETFIDAARTDPDRVVVAPYKIYTPTARAENLRKPLYVHRRYNGTPEGGSTYFVDEGEPACHLFGLGMTYLPRDIVADFLDAWPGHFSDASFSGWHYRNVTAEVPIIWDAPAVHLHYLIERMVPDE